MSWEEPNPTITPAPEGPPGPRGPGSELVCAAMLCALWAGGSAAQPQAGVPGQAGSFTVSPLAGFHEPVVEAPLYNPPVDEVPWKEPGAPETMRKIKPSLIISASGLPDGAWRLTYRIESGETVLHAGTAGPVTTPHGRFEQVVTLERTFPGATRVSYQLESEKREVVRGRATLRWSRFRGQVKYLDGGWRSTYAELHPNGFASPALFYVPIGDDGRFDAWLPARVYSVINVNGAGYSRDAMERWAWDYDLTRDREEVFTIGRTELYAMHAFNIVGGPRTVFVAFRPTALSRVLRFDADGDGRVSAEERNAMTAAMKDSPTVIGPELEAADVTVWLNGVAQKIEQFNRIPEFDGDFWQVQYLLQFMPEPRPDYGVWHEIKLEVRSKEHLRGEERIDFGQGSVGFWRK